jgi:Ca2+/Na+ antiporter
MPGLVKLLGVVSVIIAYACLASYYALDIDEMYSGYLFNVAWISGITSALINGVYAAQKELNEFVISLLGLCALVWLPIILQDISLSLGVPSLIVFALLVFYIHLSKPKQKSKKA